MSERRSDLQVLCEICKAKYVHTLTSALHSFINPAISLSYKFESVCKSKFELQVTLRMIKVIF